MFHTAKIIKNTKKDGIPAIYKNICFQNKEGDKKKIVDCCVNRIEFNKFNPLIKGKLDDKKIHEETKDCRKDSIFVKELLNADINLTKIFTQMLNLTIVLVRHSQ